MDAIRHEKQRRRELGIPEEVSDSEEDGVETEGSTMTTRLGPDGLPIPVRRKVKKSKRQAIRDEESLMAEVTVEQPRMPGAKGLQVHGPRVRPPGGSIGFGYIQTDLITILNTPTTELKRRKDRRAQLLLRMYGSDGGEWAYQTALSYITPVVNGIGEEADA